MVWWSNSSNKRLWACTWCYIALYAHTRGYSTIYLFFSSICHLLCKYNLLLRIIVKPIETQFKTNRMKEKCSSNWIIDNWMSSNMNNIDTVNDLFVIFCLLNASFSCSIPQKFTSTVVVASNTMEKRSNLHTLSTSYEGMWEKEWTNAARKRVEATDVSIIIHEQAFQMDWNWNTCART